MADYTKLKLSEAQEILGLYAKGNIQNLVPLSLGISNSNYRVELESGEKLLLKVSNDKGAGDLKKEQEILLALKESHFTYSICSLTTKDGEQVYQFKNFFGVVFPFVEGIPPGPSDQTCFEIGRGLATLHTTGVSESLNIRNHEEVGYGPKEIVAFLKDEECPEFFKNYFNELFPDKLSSFLKQNFKEGVIHGDLYYDNTLFHNDTLNKILDFEQAGIGEFILDLGISISGTCLEKENIILPLVDSYMKGYESVRPLPETEKQFLNEAILVGLFSISLWRIKRFTTGNLNPLMADSYKKLLYRAESFATYLREINES